MTTNIFVKLLNIQAELKAPKGQFNSFGKYYFRSCEDILEAVKPIAIANKCIATLSDIVVEKCGRPYVESTATLHDTESEAVISVTASAREEVEKKGMDASQMTGTSSSYARKYALNGLFAIDDTKDSDSTNEGVDKPKNGWSEPPRKAKPGDAVIVPKPASTDDDPLGKKPECIECHKPITAGIVTFSMRKYGKPLCTACQKKEEN